MALYKLFEISKNFKDLFNKRIYEEFILELMNKSNCVFPSLYKAVSEQSGGQCDFIDIYSGEKFDAKLPVRSDQIEMLTDGKKHGPQLERWLLELRKEIAEFNPIMIKSNPSYSVSKTKLYTIIKEAILRDKKDENIIFFLPFPITVCTRTGVFLQFASDYLTAIDDASRAELDLENQKIYAVYPSSEKNYFVVRKIGSTQKEYIYSDKLEEYFTYEVTDIAES